MNVEPVHYRKFLELPHPARSGHSVIVTATRGYVTCKICLEAVKKELVNR